MKMIKDIKTYLVSHVLACMIFVFIFLLAITLIPIMLFPLLPVNYFVNLTTK